MTWLDQLLQRWRVRMALAELPQAPRLLDIGTHDGTVFRLTGATGVGIDPELIEAPGLPGVTLVKGFFPVDLPTLADGTFDAATALAVVEHIPEPDLATWAKVLAQLMAPNGRVIIHGTVADGGHNPARSHATAPYRRHRGAPAPRVPASRPGQYLHRAVVAAAQAPHISARPEYLYVFERMPN